MTAAPPPDRYRYLEFNSPLSSELAAHLVRVLVRRDPATVVDVGCGWGELLLRALAAAPSATGTGIDHDPVLLERARTNALARGLADRLALVADWTPGDGRTADTVICIGADHIFGSQATALDTLRPMVRPGGRLLFGTGFWTTPPAAAQAAAIGAHPDDFRDLAGLVDMALAAGFRLLDLRTAGTGEWEAFEFGYLAGWEEWLLEWPDADGADALRARSDDHRHGYLHGWRDVMGFAYLTLTPAP